MDHLILARIPDQTRPSFNKKELNESASALYHSSRSQSKNKGKKYVNFAKELKKLNIKVTVISIIVRAVRTISQKLEKRIGELEIQRKIETVQITALLRSAKILRRIL